MEPTRVQNLSDGVPTQSLPSAEVDTDVSATSVEELPKQIDRYQVRGLLGSGGFGRVYYAFDPVIKRYVALKVPGRVDRWTSQHEHDFLDEARKAAQLKHPHAVTIYDAGRHAEHGVYIVMEYVDGETLSQYLKREPIDVPNAVRVIRQVAAAMHEAHRQGLVHRDLKPSNILLDRKGDAHVADFGLALPEERLSLERGIVSGTLPYMSPEQISGQTHLLDGRCDIWSLGVILYECLTGRRPFASGAYETVKEDILLREPKPPRQVNDRVPRQLEEICLKCLSKNISGRFSTAKDLEEALTSVASPAETDREPLSVQSSTARLSEELAASVRREGRRWTIAAALTMVCGMIIAAAAWYPDSNRHETAEGSASANDAGAGADSAAVPSVLPAVPHSDIAAARLQEVLVLTRPDKARIVVYPIAAPYGFPDGERRVEAEQRSPAKIRLQPGDYLVVAALDDGRFHEVIRHVPEKRYAMGPHSYDHMTWENRADNSIEWPEIRIPAANVADGMGLFVGASTFRMGDPENRQIPAHNRSVAAFHLDPHEVSWGEFLDNNTDNQPPLSLLHLRDQLPDRALPIAGIWYQDAVSYAEKIGKRIPTEAEYEFAATAGGTRRFPWGDDASVIEQWELGPAGTPEFDRVDAGAPVYGLYSNVAEWTSSWASAYPPLLDYQPGLPPRPDGFWIVRGGPFSVITGAPEPDQFSIGPRSRIGQHEKELHPGLGFRCARSARPRLEASDLERFVRD